MSRTSFLLTLCWKIECWDFGEILSANKILKHWTHFAEIMATKTQCFLCVQDQITEELVCQNCQTFRTLVQALTANCLQIFSTEPKNFIEAWELFYKNGSSNQWLKPSKTDLECLRKGPKLPKISTFEDRKIDLKSYPLFKSFDTNP